MDDEVTTEEDAEVRPSDKYTKEEMDEIAPRWPNGQLKKGARLGDLGKGIKKGSKKLEREKRKWERSVKKRILEEADNLLTENVGDIISVLYERAMEGDTAALALYMRHTVPAAPKAENRVDSEFLDSVKNEPPERVIQAVTAAMLSGDIDVDTGRTVIAACKESIQANVIDKFRRLVKQASETNMSIEDRVEALVKIGNEFEPIMLEGQAERVEDE